MSIFHIYAADFGERIRNETFPVIAVESLIPILVVIYALYILLKPVKIAPPQVKSNIYKTNFRKVDFAKTINEKTPKTGDSYLIVGAGFLGKKIIHALLLRGETKIRAVDLDPTACDCFGDKVEFIRADCTNPEQMKQACEGIETVYCTFAIIRFMDYLPHEKFISEKINVQGTKVVLKAAQEAGVNNFINTSSSNVSVGHDCAMGMDEKSPYVTEETSPNHYGWTKALAEAHVLKSDKENGMRTIAIRPCSGIFGAEDRHMLDSVLKTGRMILPPSGGQAIIDFVGVENVVWGHLLAEAAMRDQNKADLVCGEAFCVSNNDPMKMLDFVEIANHLRPGGVSYMKTPEHLLTLVAYGVDMINRFVPTKYKPNLGKDLSSLTPATLGYLKLSYSFNSTKAQQLLGYEPLYTVEEAVHKSVTECIEQRMLPPLVQ